MKSVYLLFSVAVLVSCTTHKNKVTDTGRVQRLSEESRTAKAVSITLPTFNLMDAHGKIVSLQSFKGKKIFVNLWASWCPPCRAEMPSIQKLARGLDPSKVAFVLVSLDNDFEKAKAFAQKQKLDLPIYYPAEDLPQLFSVQGIPATFIFNEKGDLIRRIDGGENYYTRAYHNLLK